ncbi:MAG TPA: ZIP family metal transporter [Candidatus Kapabacteria bacterium]|nr:ZIP family metal transporter [Candidatus Kapabacteria bacterium]
MNAYRLILSVITFFSTMAGGLFTLRFKSKLHYFLAFSAGTLVTISFLDLLPESSSIAQQNGVGLPAIFTAALIGFVVYHLLEKLILIHSHAQEEGESHEHVIGTMGGSALIVHSFLDGFAIGTGFQASFNLGLLVAMGVILHDFADGLNTVTFLLQAKSTRKRAITFLVADATAPVLGALLTYVFSIPVYWLAFILAWFVGEFLYLGAADLLPAAHQVRSSNKTILSTLFGVLVIWLLTGLLNH